MRRQYVNVRIDAEQAKYLRGFGNLTKAVRDGLRKYLTSIGADPYMRAAKEGSNEVRANGR